VKLGIRIAGARPAEEAVELAVAAEAAGFHDVWLTEDYLERGIFSIAGAIAVATSHVRVGLGIVNPFTRHPALIAMEAAGLDELLGGRLVLGLGASNARWMNEWLGINHTRPQRAVREARSIIDGLLRGEPIHHAGERFEVRASLAYPPARRPPIWFGVKGQRGLTAAAEDADGVILSVLSSPAYVRWARSIVGDTMELAAFVEVAIDDDGDRARDSLRPFVARFLGMHGDGPITRLGGLASQTAEHFRSALAAGRPAASSVTDEMLDEFVIAGDRAACVDGLRRYAASSLDSLVVGDWPDRPPSDVVAATVGCWSEAGLSLG